METTHKVVLDYAGCSESIPRLTCYSDGCNCATLVREPYMNSAMWQSAVDQFKQQHPHQKPIPWSEYQTLIQSQTDSEVSNKPEDLSAAEELDKKFCWDCGNEMHPEDTICWNIYCPSNQLY